jgi:predicted permease
MPIRRKLRSILWRVPVELEVREELAHHHELRTRELTDRGWAPDAARAEAARRLSGVEDTLARLGARRNRAFARRDRLQDLGQDVAFALRQCRLRPGFTAAAVLTLALGIGATTAIFSAVYAVILKPYPFPNPERVLYVFTTWREGVGATSVGNFNYLRQRVTSLEQFAAGSYSSFNLSDDAAPERVLGMRVTWNYFPVFGIPPLHGRTFAADEDQPGRERVVVLSHRLWQRRYAGDPAIVGRQIRVSGVPHDILGIMPAAFDEMDTARELWVPAAFTPERLAMHDEHYLELYGLRRADVTLAQVNEELTRAALGLRRDHPEFNVYRGAGARVYGEFLTADSRTRLFVLLAAVLLVLLIACGNVANLLLARLAARSRELAIRAAIGAGRGRILRQILTESLVLAGLGTVGGVLLAWWALPALVASAPSGVPRLFSATLSPPVLLGALILALASATIVGLLPAWQATGLRSLRGELGDGKGTPTETVRPWVREVLIGGQAALVLIVLAGAGVLVRTAINLQRVPIGFDPAGTLAARVGLIGPQYGNPEQLKTTFLELLERIEAAPGVEVAALDSQVPLVSTGGASNGLVPEGRPTTMENAINSRSHFITPDFFRVLRVPLRAGRFFTADDVRAAPLVMIVNETLARAAFGTGDPIGKRIACCGGAPGKPSWKTVVGVVADVRSRGPAVDPQPEFYLPVAQIPDVAWTWIQGTLNVIVRPATGEPAALAGVIRDSVRQIDPALPVYNIMTLDEGLRRTLAQARFNTTLMSLLGLTGLILAALGIYSVIAWLVSQRTREIGVRMALGASAPDVVKQITKHGLRPVLCGLVVGAAGALAAGSILEPQLFKVGARDPVSLTVVAGLLLVVASCAAIVPAWRAASIDPARALHDA